MGFWGFRVQCRGQGLGFRDAGRVWGLGFRVWALVLLLSCVGDGVCQLVSGGEDAHPNYRSSGQNRW